MKDFSNKKNINDYPISEKPVIMIGDGFNMNYINVKYRIFLNSDFLEDTDKLFIDEMTELCKSFFSEVKYNDLISNPLELLALEEIINIWDKSKDFSIESFDAMINFILKNIKMSGSIFKNWINDISLKFCKIIIDDPNCFEDNAKRFYWNFYTSFPNFVSEKDYNDNFYFPCVFRHMTEIKEKIVLNLTEQFRRIKSDMITFDLGNFNLLKGLILKNKNLPNLKEHQIITTNYDSFLEMLFNFDGYENRMNNFKIEDLMNNLNPDYRKTQRVVHHLHGGFEYNVGFIPENTPISLFQIKIGDPLYSKSAYEDFLANNLKWWKGQTELKVYGLNLVKEYHLLSKIVNSDFKIIIWYAKEINENARKLQNIFKNYKIKLIFENYKNFESIKVNSKSTYNKYIEI